MGFMDPADLAMIPIYCGVEGEEKAGLCCRHRELLGRQQRMPLKKTIQATLDFLDVGRYL